MGDFEDLRLADGSGAEHVNRFRVYFRAGPPVTAANMLQEFLAHFPGDFTPNNIADVVVGDRGSRTLKFTLHVNGPRLHDDWVGIRWQTSRNYSADFAVQTLKCNFDDMTDVELALLIQTLGALGGPLGAGAGAGAAEFAKYANKFHFLAGRRSWVFCDAAHEPSGSGSAIPSAPPSSGRSASKPAPGLFFLETAAVERESKAWFELLEKVPAISTAMANHPMRELILILWSTLLTNYVQMNRLQVQDAPASSRAAPWQRRGPVYWTTDTSERQSVVQLHPFLGS